MNVQKIPLTRNTIDTRKNFQTLRHFHKHSTHTYLPSQERIAPFTPSLLTIATMSSSPPQTPPKDSSSDLLPMGSKTQNDVLREENAKLKRENSVLKKEKQNLRNRNSNIEEELIGPKSSKGKELQNLRQQLSKAENEIQDLKYSKDNEIQTLKDQLSKARDELNRLKTSKPAGSSFLPPKQAQPPRSAAFNPGVKRKDPPVEADTAHTKQAKFGAPGGSSAPFSATPPAMAEPVSDPLKGSKAPPFSGASNSGFGGWAAGGSSFGAGGTPLGSFGSGGKIDSSQSGFMGAKPGILPFVARCAAWKRNAEEVFARAKKSGVLEEADFPEPPEEKCMEKGCEEQNEGRVLKACEHVVSKALREIMGTVEKVEVMKKFLEEQRRLWHPDVGRRFAGEDMEKAERLGRKFGEVSRCVGELLEPLLGKGEWMAEAVPEPREL